MTQYYNPFAGIYLVYPLSKNRNIIGIARQAVVSQLIKARLDVWWIYGLLACPLLREMDCLRLIFQEGRPPT